MRLRIFPGFYNLRRRRVWFSDYILGMVSLVAALQLGMVARAAGLQVLGRHLPGVAAQLAPVGRLSSTNRLNLAIGLPLRNPVELANLLEEINDPASANYHHYLTPEQFTKQFGPGESDYQAVIAFARHNGLRVTAQHPNRMLLDVSGTVAEVERALHVRMRTYQHPTENRIFFAPETGPTLDLATPVLSISGLNNYALPQPRLVARALAGGENASPNGGSGPGGTYKGKDFRAAYVPDSTLNGSGQTVGLLQFDGYNASDIAYYVNQAGLPGTTLSNVLLDGFSGNPTGSGGEVEVCLDIEMAVSMATNLSQVIVYEAGPFGNWHDLLNRMATDNLAKQLSCSWYIPGGGPDAMADQIWQQMAAQGQSFFNASGDDDAYPGLIDFPGDTPYITQVGGTTLTTSGPAGHWVSEKVWNWGNGIGSGGGISTSYSIPTWQTNVSMTGNQGSTTKRNTPDVALTADQVYVRADGHDYNVGGTSCSAPLWAGFAALVNQQASASGRPAIGFVNPAVYAIGAGANYSPAFHDIITGNNKSPGSPAKFSAVGGFDLCTGWGTPAGQNLINALANPEALQITPPDGFAAIGGVGGPFTVSSESLSLTNTGTNSLTWSVASPSAWLAVSPSGGTLTPAGPAATVMASLNVAASNLVVGAYSATVWFTNLNDNYGQGRQFGLSVISPPVITVQPTNQSTLEGATAEFIFSATGGMPLSYQWQENGTNLTDGGNLSGSTTTDLLISNVAVADVGTYTVVVTNAAGVVTSSNASLTITPSKPVITLQPTSQTVVVSEPAEFTVATIGTTPFSYQWSFDGTNLDVATNQTLILSNVQLTQSGTYAVVVTNVYGFAASSNVVLNVLTNFPLLDVDFGADSPAVSLESGYAALGIMTNDFWNDYSRNDGNGGYLTFGAVTNLLLVDQTVTQVGITVANMPGAWGNSSNDSMYQGYIYPFSGDGIVTVTNLPAGEYDVLAYSQDGNYEVTVGGTSYGVKTTYDSVASGAPVWTEGVQYARFRNVTVGSGDPLVLTVRNGVGGYAILSGIQILGSAPAAPVITSQPTNQTVAVGESATFNVTASGTTPFSYQWSFDTTNLVGATNATLVLDNVQFAQAGNYAVQVSNVGGATLSSNAVLTVVDKLDHFSWNPILSPRFVNVPITVIVQAQDATNGIFTNFSGTVILSSTSGIPINPAISTAFVQGTWTGSITISQPATNLVLQASDSNGALGVANVIDVDNLPILGLTLSGSSMLIYWPVASTDFVLETSASLSPAQWVQVAIPPFQIGSVYLESVPINNTNQFYRLQYTHP